VDAIPLVHGTPVVVLLLIAVLGLAVGSFLNVVILRLPPRLAWQWQTSAGTSGTVADPPKPPPGLVRPGSRCPTCKQSIHWWENIPLLSYVLLRGRCSHCDAHISLRYPAVEALTALLSITVVWVLGLDWQLAAALILTWGLIVLSFVDLDHMLLPDVITLPLLWLGLLVNLAGGFCDIGSAVIGAVSGYLVLWIIFHVYRMISGREGFGYGDFKLLAALGAWLGWQMLPLVLLLASLCGAVIGITLIMLTPREARQPLPFGPYLAVAGWIVLLWGDALLATYLQFAAISF
jgi:leader peptidase (prepilin peptidase)/N-methyltransferase|tara:strand:- start:1337 stop:2209 length:873 start_codon:yes stop_codon:yes gene_type:complete